MSLVLAVSKEGFPIIGYQEDREHKPILSSVFVIKIADRTPSETVRLQLDGDNYMFLRGELLTREKYDPETARLSREDANQLRHYLREHFEACKGLEGEL